MYLKMVAFLALPCSAVPILGALLLIPDLIDASTFTSASHSSDSWSGWFKSLISTTPDHAKAFEHVDDYFTRDIEDEEWQPVDEDFSWNKRRTGVTKTWSSGSGIWIHYNATAMDEEEPMPWTQGNMIKFLRQRTSKSFELRSVYENEAAGLWRCFMKPRPQGDGLLTQGHTFRSTPYRVTDIRATDKKASDETEEEREDELLSRVTIVQPDGATISGPRTIAADSQFAELWVSETINDHPEAVKTGLFCQYNTTSGDLIQVFRIHEINTDGRVPRSWWRHLLGRPAVTPYQKLDCTALRQKVLSDPEVTARLPSHGWEDGILPISDLVGTLLRRRIVRTQAPHDSTEEAFELGPDNNIIYEDMENGYGGASCDLYWTHRFDDGMFLRLPRNIFAIPDDALVCFEFGCWRCDGNYHRVMLYGSQASGGLHTSVYDEWEGLP